MRGGRPPEESSQAGSLLIIEKPVAMELVDLDQRHSLDRLLARVIGVPGDQLGRLAKAIEVVPRFAA